MKVVQRIEILADVWLPWQPKEKQKKKLKQSSCQKSLDSFQYNLAEMFLWWSSTKIVQAIMIRQKTWSPEGRGLFSLYIYIEKIKNLLVRNYSTDFNITWQKCSFGDPLLAQAVMIRLQNMASRG